MVPDAVQKGRRQLLVAEDLHPLAEGEVLCRASGYAELN
jgi:hypothetical protein